MAGKVAVITGGAGGIGLGMARAVAGAGMKLVLADIDESRLARAVDGLVDEGAAAFGVPTDVADRASVDVLVAEVVTRYGAAHLLCNNAGGPFPRSVMEVTVEDLVFVLGANLFGVLNGIQAFLPIMRAQGEGHINATSSLSGLLAFPPVVAYNIAKFGVIALMETLARELREAESPVEASVLCPAAVATHAVENAMANARAAGHEPSPSEAASAVEAQAGLLGTGLDPDDVGGIVLDGVREGRFWIFTHPQLIDGPVRDRFEAMVADGGLPDS